MSQHEPDPRTKVGLFLNPVAQRRVDFQAVCGEQFGRLFLADGCEQATLLLGQQDIDLLIIDLERFDRNFDSAALLQLIGQRGDAATLVLCPFTGAGWLPDLLAAGPVDYAITPLLDQDLGTAVAARLAGQAAADSDAAQLRRLMASSSLVQHAIAEVDDFEKMADRICVALGSLPGVVHVSLFYMREPGELQLEAQHSTIGLNLTRILARPDRLMQSPLRHAFPGLLAACGGELTLLDVPAKAGEPELALSLADSGVNMVVGLPLPVSRAGVQRGALCLMFGHARQLSGDDLTALMDMTRQAGFGLRMAEMSRENEQLQERLTHLGTTDALTGVANRRHGEYLLELEMRRARRYKLPMSLIVFDIDRLKAVNDQFGHPVGDAAVRAVADGVQQALRSSDTLVRSAGGEFQIIASHTSAIDALKIAEKIRQAIATTDIPGCDRVSISLGAGQAAESDSPDALLVRVEAALARAKRAGRNCVELALQ
ncbi:GGDEF domain-containing protein [Massilia sp. PAMC28688]|uniref:GGDEF domain-containing protein n=1 Tax=Massilia sp. PAMC28688 TaxID=2861283 RepID=UPI001C634BE8|nr:GGDEF domain-containing protein [Massilia sp. PAMC28688]QYF93400.1 GGDEF domain-containing protein [Massilia sp. PAMC28688]